MLFNLGQVVATPGALRTIEENSVNTWDLLRRHANGDSGCIPKEYQLENQLSIVNGYRIISSYLLNDRGDKVWVITEADRSSTCLLLPEEY